jgi:hypothetical protein
MNELERPGGSRLPRKSREDRAYRLVLAGGALGLVAVVGFILAIAGVVSAGWPILATILALVCGWLFRRTVS